MGLLCGMVCGMLCRMSKMLVCWVGGGGGGGEAWGGCGLVGTYCARMLYISSLLIPPLLQPGDLQHLTAPPKSL